MSPFAKQRSKKSLLSYQPRRPVPWKGFDVVLVLCLYFVMPICVVQAAWNWFGMVATPAVEEPKLDMAHPLARALLESRSPWAILACIASAVLVAPVAEEILFRLLLQGWLEAAERRLRRQLPWLRRMAVGLLPVATTSLLFAALHFRGPSPQLDIETLLFFIGAHAVANLLTVGVALCWMRFGAGATLTDIGIVPRRLAADVKLGMLAFFTVAMPVYATMIVVTNLLPPDTVADPIPLLLLAVVLGGLYFRTHRIVPSIVLHMAFNATSVILALWTSS